MANTNPSIWLGFPGDYVSGREDCYVCKIGGSPLVPASLAQDVRMREQFEDGSKCTMCSQRMNLLMQTHAPLTSKQVSSDLPDRFLFVFCCVNEACAASDDSFRAIRVQRKPSPPSPDQVEASPVIHDKALLVQDGGYGGHDAGGDWGGDAWGIGGDAPPSSSSMDLANLNRALLARTVVHQKQPSKPSRPAPTSPVASTSTVALPSTSTPFAAFHLYAQLEPSKELAEKKLDARELAELEHAKRLLSQYEEEERKGSGGGGGASSISQAPPPTRRSNPKNDKDDDDDDDEYDAAPAEETAVAWSGEAYEPDRTRGASEAFLRFQRRLARAPAQCARYAFGSELLWPSDHHAAALAKAPSCPHCGAKRIVELQLVSPLILQLEVGAAEQLEYDPTMPVIGAPSTWEWATVAIVTCQGACGNAAEEEWTVRQEACLMAHE